MNLHLVYVSRCFRIKFYFKGWPITLEIQSAGLSANSYCKTIDFANSSETLEDVPNERIVSKF